MELTPKVFRDVQFREKLRGGYHPEDVDEFLEQAALGAEALLEQVKQANERAVRAEAAATEASNTDEALKKMLLMAQRTADQAVKEAVEDADKMLADARAQSEALLADAEARGKASYEAAVNDRRSTMDSADAALAQAQQEVEALKGWVDLHRNHLLGIMREAQTLIENAGLVSDAPGVTPLPAKFLTPAEGEGEGARDRSGRRDGDTGEWDPSFLNDLDDQTAHAPAAGDPFGHGTDLSGPHEAETVSPPEVGAPSPHEGIDNQGASGWQAIGPAVAGAEGERTGAAQLSSTATATGANPAFDERALDNFFSDQDMGNDRGLGRFRRRQ